MGQTKTEQNQSSTGKSAKKPLSKGMKIGLVIVLAAAVGVLGLSVYKLVDIRNSYQEANDVYEDLESIIMSAAETGEDTDAQAAKAPGEDVSSPVSQEGDLQDIFAGDDMQNRKLSADAVLSKRHGKPKNDKKQMIAFPGFGKASMPWSFPTLHDMYPDSVGWIWQEDTMSYPIVQGADNYQYMRHLIDGKYNVAGTLFVDYVYEDALDGRYSVIYGHNMDDKSMFGSITSYSDEAYYHEHPFFEIYVGDEMYQYHVYAAMRVDEDSQLLLAEDHMTDEAFLELMKWVDEQKVYTTKAPKITKNSVVTVLATCVDYPRDYDYRYVVVLVREKRLLP